MNDDRLISRWYLLTDDEMVDILDHAPKPCPMEFKDEPKIRAIAFWQNLKSIAARDKWWVDRLILAERKCRDLVCEHYRECDCIDSFGGNLCIWWQQLKKELEENNG